MDIQADATVWLRAVEQGDETAYTQLWNWCFPKLVKIAKHHINPSKRRVYDEEDASLSAIGSFFREVEEGKFSDVANQNELWKILTTKLLRKIINRRRMDSAKKRGSDGVRGDSVLSEMGLSGFHHVPEESDKGPEFIVDLVDEANAVLLQLNPQMRTLALLKMNGSTNNEAAWELGIDTRSVERKIAQLRVQFEEPSTLG